jgi:hypothetical protein
MRIEPGTCRIRSRSLNHLTTTFGKKRKNIGKLRNSKIGLYTLKLNIFCRFLMLAIQKIMSLEMYLFPIKTTLGWKA